MQHQSAFHQQRKAIYDASIQWINSTLIQDLGHDRPHQEGEVPFSVLGANYYYTEAASFYQPSVGSVYACGSFDDSQLGFCTIPQEVACPLSVKAMAPQQVEEDEENVDTWTSKFIHVKSLNPSIVSLACGSLHSLALTNDGHVYSWGNNDEGQCGRPFWNSSNNYEKDFTNIQTPYRLEDLKEPIIAVACGVSHSLLLSLSGNVYFFGTYKNGNAKDFRPWAKDKQDRVYPIEREEFSHREKARVKALEASIRQQKRDIENGHIQVMDAFLIENDPDDTIQCVSPPKGKQFYPIRLEVPGKAVKIACGHCFSAAILEDGSCVTWGVLEGTDGPIDVNLQPLKWYDELALAKSNMKRSVITIACGDYHLLLVASDPLSSGDWNVFSSGRNNYGQLGLGYVSTDVTTLIREPTKVPFFENKNIAHVAAGVHHSLCLDITGRNLYSFGRGDYGQLGTSLDLPYAGYHESTPQPVFLDLQSANKEKNTVRANSTLVSIACGDSHSMAVTENGELFTWGFNDVGLLGHGGVDDSYCPRKVEGIPKVLLADGGSQHTMILTERH